LTIRARFEDAAALGDEFPDREDCALRQVGAVQRGALTLGEPGPPGAEVEEPIQTVLAQPAGDGEIAGAAPSDVGAAAILATRLRKFFHDAKLGSKEERQSDWTRGCLQGPTGCVPAYPGNKIAFSGVVFLHHRSKRACNAP
jgi:hypothetical protein